jgi:hypothetical protein
MTHVQLLTNLARYDDRRCAEHRYHRPHPAPAPSRRAHPRSTRFVAALMRVSRTSAA